MIKERNIIQEIDVYMEKNADSIVLEIENIVDEFLVKKRRSSEEDFKMMFTPILNRIADDIGIRLEPLYERSVYKGRIDALYNLANLEYKAPDELEPRNYRQTRPTSNHTYIEQVKRQLKGLAKREKLQLDSLLGIIFDGRYLIYVNYLSTDWYVSEPEAVNKFSITKFIKRLFSLQVDKAVTITNLVEDFGFKSEIAIESIKAFYKSIDSNIDNNDGLKLLFEQWNSLFREVSGYSFDSMKLNLKEIKDIYDVGEEDIKIDFLIFSIHTYYALLIKTLVIQILYHHKKNSAFNQPLKYETNTLALATMTQIENGGRFRDLGIRNFLEGDFFGWYINVWDEEMYSVVSKILNKFDEYNYETINLDERNSRDLLKKLYNYLLPRTLRHALGEYYSPDWLAQRTYSLMDINGNKDISVLDPSCGSGTFIVIAIKEIIEKNIDVPKKQLLNNIINNVHGFDLNPLAVIAARANYIIALGDLIDSTDEEIELPIFHCDAMLTILEQPKGNSIVRKLATRAGVYEIPTEIVNNKTQLVNVLEIFNKYLDRNIEFNNDVWNEIRTINEVNIDEENTEDVKTSTEVFYNQIKELDEKGIRKVWIQIIKNSFAPIFHEKVDYIIGNPPWVNWQTLPEDYRESIQNHWYTYKVFDFTGLEARLGNAHDDISVLLTYVVMDNFLKDKGELGFIINQNLLQAHGGGDGFRKFTIREEIPVKAKLVEDYVEVQPFKSLGASNKTAIIILQKGEETTYPVPYIKWERKERGTIDSDDLIDSVMNKIKDIPMVAEPIKKEESISSPWIVVFEDELDVMKKLVGTCGYRGRKGVDTSANGIYWIEIEGKSRGRISIRNTPENSRKDIPEVTCNIENTLVYPLVRGRDISKWCYETPYSIIIPYKENFKDVLTMEELRALAPLTYNYFYNSETNPYVKEFKDILVNRGIYKKHYKSINTSKEIPAHVLYNIGEYTKSTYKVVWKTLQSKGMNTCVISEQEGKVIVPDHNNILVPFEDEREAHYLCGVLNSKIVGDFVDAYISWFKSAHILDNIYIPEYNMKNDIHQQIAEKSIEAHNEAKKIGKDKLNSSLKIKDIEEEIDNLVMRLLK